MSIWTHVNGSIRIDTFEGLIDSKITLNKLLGKFYDECELPGGSEDLLTLNHSFTLITKSQSMITLSFSGDLRDFDKSDVNDILIPWIKNLTKDQCVRQGFVQIEIEFPEIYIDMRYKEEEWHIKESIEE